MKLFIVNILIVFTLVLFANNASANDVQNVSNQELKLLIQQNVAIVDVRTAEEWKKTGVIEGSHLIMFYDEKGKYDLNAWLADVASVATKEQPLVLICHSGSRSRQLAHYLVKEVGYSEVYNVKRGIKRWMKENNPTIAP